MEIGRADIHIHTRYSDGSATVRQVLDHVARRTPLRVIAIADHDTLDGALAAADIAHQYPIDVIVGEEVSSRDGHILGLFLSTRVAPCMSATETVAAIHEQGGLAIAAHPFCRYRRSERRTRPVLGVGTLLATVPFDGVEVDNATPFLRMANDRARRYNRAQTNLPELGNSDAHIVQAIGRSYTVFSGQTAVDFRAAIMAGHTLAVDDRYQPGDLAAYLAYWMVMPIHRSRAIAQAS